MELEVGLKLKNVVDDFAAAELLIAKDRAGPLFLCTQTDFIFFITAHLKGYIRKNIKIYINHDGSRIMICGEKPVQEMVMAGWQVVKKEIVMRGFRKKFKIPVGVDLDKIKARFNEDESVLTISMSKLVKGLVEDGVEELKEEEMPEGETDSLPIVDDKEDISEHVRVHQEEYSSRLEKEFQEEGTQTDQEKEFQEKGTQTDQDIIVDIQEQEKCENDQVEPMSLMEPSNVRTKQRIQEQKEADDEPNAEEKGEEIHDQSSEKDRQRKSKKNCTPVIIVGSSLIVSLVVVVFHLIRSNNQTRKKN